MHFLERNLEDVIYNTDNRSLKEHGLFISGFKFRQVRIGEYGICDLITVKRKEHWIDITVYELKKDDITEQAFLQALRYVKGLSRWIEKTYGEQFLTELSFNIVLIGAKRPYSPLLYASDVIDNFMMYEYDVDINGIWFNKIEYYHLQNEGF